MLFQLAKLAAAICLFIVLTLFSLVAFAGDVAVTATVADPTAIKFQEMAVTVIGFIFGGLSALYAYFSKKVFDKEKGKIPLNVEHKAAIDNAITVGLREAEAKLKALVRTAPDLHVKNETVATAANFVLTSAPTALTALNITPGKLDAMIRDRLELQETEQAQAAGGGDA